MKQKIIIGLGFLALAVIMGYFLGVAVVVVALLFFGIGYIIARRRKGSSRGKDTVTRIRR